MEAVVRAAGEPQTGEVIAGKYRIERVIGRGGMGRVLAARHLATGKKVALKWILDGESAEARERFAREARAAGRIHHANVVDVYDVLEHDGATCLVMELLGGESLASCLARERSLPVEQAVPVAMEIARGLWAAHLEGVIHRDLKPGNVFLTEGQGRSGVKILDFGISKILDASDAEPVTRSGAVLGTPHYMSPEQVLGMNPSDPRIDQYALGAVLYEMLSGRTPHVHEKVTALLVLIATEPTVPIGERVPGLPRPLDAAIMRALAKKPEHRFPSVADFAVALEPFAGGMRFDGSSSARRPRVLESPGPSPGAPSSASTMPLGPAVHRHDERAIDATPPTRDARTLASTRSSSGPSSGPSSVPSKEQQRWPLAAAVGIAGFGLAALAWATLWPSSPEPISPHALPDEAPPAAVPASAAAPPASAPVRAASVGTSEPPTVTAPPLDEPPAAGIGRAPRAARERASLASAPLPVAVELEPSVEEPAVTAAPEPAEPVVVEDPVEPTAATGPTETPRAGRIGLDDF